MKTELPIIHTLRGFSVMGICLYHYVCCTTGYVGPGIVFDTFALLALNVQIFFVISAMVIPISMINAQYRIQDFFTFVYKRALRIEPPYLISLLIAAAYLNLRNYIPGSASVDLAPGWDELLMHIGYLVPFFEDARWINPVYWSSFVEFQYYILLGLLFPLPCIQRYGCAFCSMLCFLSGHLFPINPVSLLHGAPCFYWAYCIFYNFSKKSTDWNSGYFSLRPA